VGRLIASSDAEWGLERVAEAGSVYLFRVRR
jgi:hypothetical protein